MGPIDETTLRTSPGVSAEALDQRDGVSQLLIGRNVLTRQ
jgi:hypothetical protein